MTKFTEEQILKSYEGRCIEDAKDPGYCGSCSIDIHRAQLNDPNSWVHFFVNDWLNITVPEPTYEQIKAQNKEFREVIQYVLELEKYWYPQRFKSMNFDLGVLSSWPEMTANELILVNLKNTVEQVLKSAP
jgi:hypothetical protein